MNLIKYTFSIFIFFFLFACKKDKIEDPSLSQKNYTNGMLVLCEGLFNQNNSTLAWFDLQTTEIESDVFEKENGRALGDIGNDMILYGGKIYIAVTTSSTVEVLDKNTLKSIQQFTFNYQNKVQQPRYLAAENGKVFITSYDGLVSVLDTTSLTISKRIKVGRNPEGICVSGNSLFVANSGGLDYANPDTTVMKIDINTLEVTSTFVVGKNPGQIVADDFGYVYVVKQGDYANDKSKLVRINPATNEVVELDIFATNIREANNLLYIGYYDFNSGSSRITIYDCVSQQISKEFNIPSQTLTTLYGVYPAPEQDGFICLDAMNFVNSGLVKFFDETGNLITQHSIGLNPNTILFIP